MYMPNLTNFHDARLCFQNFNEVLYSSPGLHHYVKTITDIQKLSLYQSMNYSFLFPTQMIMVVCYYWPVITGLISYLIITTIMRNMPANNISATVIIMWNGTPFTPSYERTQITSRTTNNMNSIVMDWMPLIFWMDGYHFKLRWPWSAVSIPGDLCSYSMPQRASHQIKLSPCHRCCSGN